MANITTYLNNIKNAVFGRDVRDSIHDAIKQCYDDASINGNANMEVTLARGEYNNLNERLDSHSSQIKEKENEINILQDQIPLKANSSDIISLEERKANTVDVDRKINAVASGSPRETFNTLEELKVKYPEGNNNIYLVLADGKWYYYNTDWLPGGIYQSQSLREKSVGDIELNVNYKIGKIISGGININFTSDILEIESGTNISDYNGFYSIANSENILMNSDSFPRYVFFNIDTKLLHVEARWFKYNPRELLICCYYRKKVFFVHNNDLIKVNGKPIPIDIDDIDGDKVKDKTITKSKLWFSFTHGCVISGGIDINLINKTISILDATVISDLSGFYNANNSNSIIKFTNDLSVPVYLYFNIDTQFIHLEDRWYSYNASEILLCTIYQNEIHNSISKKITINGKADNPFNWMGKNFVSYGDSITQGNTWQNYLVSELGVVHTNLGLSSSCISSFDTWAISMSDDSRIDNIPLDTDILTIMGGTNDWVSRIDIGNLDDETRDTFIGGYKYMIEKIMTRIPKARIILMTPPFGYYNTGVGTGETNGVGKNLIEYINAVKSVAEYYKLPVINMYQDLGVNKFNKDNFLIVEDVQVHPNVEGGKRIAGLVIGELKRLKC